MWLSADIELQNYATIPIFYVKVLILLKECFLLMWHLVSTKPILEAIQKRISLSIYIFEFHAHTFIIFGTS